MLERPAEYGPLNHVHIDLFGPIASNLSKHVKDDDDDRVCVVAMVDYFMHEAINHMKVAQLVSVAELKSTFDVACAWMCTYGVPEVITTDDGGEFDSHFEHMVHGLRIEHVKPLPTTLMLMVSLKELIKL